MLLLLPHVELLRVGFLAGPRADALAGMGPHAAVQKFLAQLDEIFGSPQELQPATSAYAKAHVFDWAQEQWVGGAYSFPSYGAEDGDREALAAPVAGTLFFAGKHQDGVAQERLGACGMAPACTQQSVCCLA